MRKLYFIVTSLVLVLFLGFSVFAQEYSYDYEQMSMDEYQNELAKWQKCEADNKAKIADEEARIAEIEEEMSSVEQQISDTWSDIYALLDTDKQGYNDYLDKLNSFEEELSGFVALQPEDIYSRKDELQSFKDRLAEMKEDKISVSPEAQNVISRIENLFGQAEEKAKPAAAGMYEVARGDYLWKIAKKPDIYGDPYAWIRIYTYNRDQIQNPDLIYPDQTFRIPRMAGPNEYWVQPGEFLYKIAGHSEVYGNSFKWQRLYEANKEVISDPNLIFPHMVLQVPAE